MTPEERAGAETRGGWVKSCRGCLWRNGGTGTCDFLLRSGRRRRKPARYGGACPEYEKRRKPK